MRAEPRAWSEGEVAQLMRVYRRIAATRKYGVWAVVAAEMPGRTAQQCQCKVRYQLNGPRGEYIKPGETHSIAQRAVIPQDVLADALARRSLAPRSLTAAFFGDPLPGRSALDRREREPSKITLPSRA